MKTLPPPSPADSISLLSAAQLLCVDGKPPSPTTVWRWARYGKDGIVLRCWMRGGRLVTTAEAVAQFDREVSQRDAEQWAKRSASGVCHE